MKRFILTTLIIALSTLEVLAQSKISPDTAIAKKTSVLDSNIISTHFSVHFPIRKELTSIQYYTWKKDTTEIDIIIDDPPREY